MENMLKFELMKYRHRLLYYRVAPIYIRYIPQKRKKNYKFDHCSRDRIVAASLPLQIYTASANPIGAVLSTTKCGSTVVMIALALPCDGMDSSSRWFESHQSFLFVCLHC